MKADIGLIGLAVMGQNLVLNMERHGYVVAVYNRTADRTREFTERMATGKKVLALYSLQDLAAALKPPRRIILMVKAGNAVDEIIEALKLDDRTRRLQAEAEAAAR